MNSEDTQETVILFVPRQSQLIVCLYDWPDACTQNILWDICYLPCARLSARSDCSLATCILLLASSRGRKMLARKDQICEADQLLGWWQCVMSLEHQRYLIRGFFKSFCLSNWNWKCALNILRCYKKIHLLTNISFKYYRQHIAL
jgi:hypothetical protein